MQSNTRQVVEARHLSMAELTHIARARVRLETKARQREERLEELRGQALEEAQAIVAMIAHEYHADRIYQWGSALRPGGFKEYSDVDIAVEGVVDARAFFAMLAGAEKMTSFPLDLVQIEKIEPEYAEEIRQYGQVVYEKR